MTRKPRSTTHIATFVEKLFHIIQNPKNSDIICWSYCGKFFIIKDINRLQSQVLSQSYRHNNLNSFIRQLNMYDFHKIKKDHIDNLCFSHILFRRGQQKLLSEIKRKASLKQKQNTQPIKILLPVRIIEGPNKEKPQKKVKFDIKEESQPQPRQQIPPHHPQQHSINPQPQPSIASLKTIKQLSINILPSFRFIGSQVSIQMNNSMKLLSFNHFPQSLRNIYHEEFCQQNCKQRQVCIGDFNVNKNQYGSNSQNNNSYEYSVKTVKYLKNKQNKRGNNVGNGHFEKNDQAISIKCEEEPYQNQDIYQSNQKEIASYIFQAPISQQGTPKMCKLQTKLFCEQNI